MNINKSHNIIISRNKFSYINSLKNKYINVHMKLNKKNILKNLNLSLKNINNNNILIKSNNNIRKNIIKKNLIKYNITPEVYYRKLINTLIFVGNNHLAAIFKDYLFWDDDIECLKRFYNKKEIKFKLSTLINFYVKYYYSGKIFKFNLKLGECKKVLINYYKNKENILKEMNNKSNIKNNNNNNLNNNNNKILENITSELHSKINSNSFILSRFNPEELLINYNENYTNENKLSRNKKIEKHEKINSYSFDSTISNLLRNLGEKNQKIKVNKDNFIINNKINNLIFYNNIKKIHKNNKKKINNNNNKTMNNNNNNNIKLINNIINNNNNEIYKLINNYKNNYKRIDNLKTKTKINLNVNEYRNSNSSQKKILLKFEKLIPNSTRSKKNINYPIINSSSGNKSLNNLSLNDKIKNINKRNSMLKNKLKTLNTFYLSKNHIFLSQKISPKKNQPEKIINIKYKVIKKNNNNFNNNNNIKNKTNYNNNNNNIYYNKIKKQL